MNHVADTILKGLSESLAAKLCTPRDWAPLEKETQIIVRGHLCRTGSLDPYHIIDLVNAP
jgi:hypothetical protein